MRSCRWDVGPATPKDRDTTILIFQRVVCESERIILHFCVRLGAEPSPSMAL